jgi:hypothetical protein
MGKDRGIGESGNRDIGTSGNRGIGKRSIGKRSIGESEHREIGTSGKPLPLIDTDDADKKPISLRKRLLRMKKERKVDCPADSFLPTLETSSYLH